MFSSVDIPLIKTYDEFKDYNKWLRKSVLPLEHIKIISVFYSTDTISILNLDSGKEYTFDLNDFIYDFIVSRKLVIQSNISILRKYDFAELYMRTHPLIFCEDVMNFIKGLMTFGYQEFKLLKFSVRIDSDDVIITKYVDESKGSKVLIPFFITKIDGHAFSENINIKEVSFQDGSRLTSIGPSAFYGCSSLTYIMLPKRLKQVLSYAFAHCGLVSVKLSEDVEIIGDGAFMGCPLTSINIPYKVTKIKQRTFSYCQELEKVTFSPNSSLEEIEKSAFSFCYNLKSLEMPESMVRVGEYAFEACGLESIIVPNNVNHLGLSVFSSCFNLKSAKISEDISEIPDELFLHCKNLEYIELPSKLKKIGKQAFSDTGIKTLRNLPESLDELAAYSFHNCARLESVELPDSITKIGRWSFSECGKLKEINIPKNVNDVSISIIYHSGVKRMYLHTDSLTNNPKLKELSDYIDFIIEDKS